SSRAAAPCAARTRRGLASAARGSADLGCRRTGIRFAAWGEKGSDPSQRAARARLLETKRDLRLAPRNDVGQHARGSASERPAKRAVSGIEKQGAVARAPDQRYVALWSP